MMKREGCTRKPNSDLDSDEGDDDEHCNDEMEEEDYHCDEI